jgi:hypothetical protein
MKEAMIHQGACEGWQIIRIPTGKCLFMMAYEARRRNVQALWP